MVLESIFPAKSVIKHPRDMFVFSFVITLASIFLADLIFPGDSSGQIIVLFISLGMAPIFYRIFTVEEEIERKEAEHKLHLSFRERHRKPILIFSMFFLGITAAVFFFALAVPDEYVVSSFESQLIEISKLTGSIRGYLRLPLCFQLFYLIM